ncbi:UNKNOWN [Stylonychia lemnae]|uniref:RING-type domain-containing protein n=1 Tax=Stylonychia lemnae TaxID=5949 RepID=A0A078AY82_STYLE|nr:UNKNOWN [Stylonychia lemnae]|eukprot:CDW85753.1 UNKNOWN [Stylonychia lemnae]
MIKEGLSNIMHEVPQQTQNNNHDQEQKNFLGYHLKPIFKERSLSSKQTEKNQNNFEYNYFKSRELQTTVTQNTNVVVNTGGGGGGGGGGSGSSLSTTNTIILSVVFVCAALIVFGIVICCCCRKRQHNYPVQQNPAPAIPYNQVQGNDRTIVQYNIQDLFNKLKAKTDIVSLQQLHKNVNQSVCCYCHEEFADSKKSIRKFKNCVHGIHSDCILELIRNIVENRENQVPEFKCPLCQMVIARI